MIIISLEFITGVVFGAEYLEDPEPIDGLDWIMMLNLFIFRIVINHYIEE
jgi:hypothetical protein